MIAVSPPSALPHNSQRAPLPFAFRVFRTQYRPCLSIHPSRWEPMVACMRRCCTPAWKRYGPKCTARRMSESWRYDMTWHSSSSRYYYVKLCPEIYIKYHLGALVTFFRRTRCVRYGTWYHRYIRYRSTNKKSRDTATNRSGIGSLTTNENTGLHAQAPILSK